MPQLLPAQQFIQRFERSPAMVVSPPRRSTIPHFPHRLNLLSWNVAKLTQKKHWQEEFSALLHQYQPDLILLQEVWVCARTQHLSSLTEIPWHFAPNFLDTHHNHYSGVLTATHSHCVASQALLTQHTEPIVQTPKVALFTKFTLLHCRHGVLIVNAHLINFVNLHRFRAQLAQIASVMQQHPGAIIFAGDFNTWHPSRWRELVAMTQRLGLSPAPFQQQESQKIKRFLNSPPLDYIFFRGFHSQPDHAKVITEAQTSDHKPLLLELSLG